MTPPIELERSSLRSPRQFQSTPTTASSSAGRRLTTAAAMGESVAAAADRTSSSRSRSLRKQVSDHLDAPLSKKLTREGRHRRPP